ncbi:MAG TPA: hypothetical protein VJ873_06975 [bacterium]|nr:hypothetical protein [bacterium]
MRLKTLILSTTAGLFIPAFLHATSFNEASVLNLNGTVMVQKADGSKPFALQTGSTVEKGDILTCYDKSWVILKTHKGDQIGLDGNTVVNIDEYYIEGPDRQIRLVLQKGNLYFKTNGCGSSQSFFEINAGSVVASINDVHAILHYDPAKETFQAQYLVGKLTVIDKDHEEKFKVNHTEYTWVGGKMEKEEPDPVDELDVINFNKFFDGEPRVAPPSNDFLLHGSD